MYLLINSNKIWQAIFAAFKKKKKNEYEVGNDKDIKNFYWEDIVSDKFRLILGYFNENKFVDSKQ